MEGREKERIGKREKGKVKIQKRKEIIEKKKKEESGKHRRTTT